MTKPVEFFNTDQFTAAEIEAASDWARLLGQDPAEVSSKFEIIGDGHGWHARFHKPRRAVDGKLVIVDNGTVCDDVIVDLGEGPPELPFLDRIRHWYAEVRAVDLG